MSRLIDEMRMNREPVIKECREFVFKGKNKKGEEVTMTNGPCTRIDGGEVCAAYQKPRMKWRLGHCPLATHIITVEEQKKKINPIKHSKRSR